MGKTWKKVLLLLGFKVPEGDGQVEFPDKEDVPLLNPFSYLIDDTIDIGKDARKVLSKITADHLKLILNLVDDQVNGKEKTPKDTTICDMFTKDPSTELFLKKIGFSVMATDDEKYIYYAG